jgi:4'-phosphopantetheinyl transferase
MSLPTLDENQIHVWTLHLEVENSEFRYYQSLLTNAEIDRANRFTNLEKRQRFIIARASLRKILSLYTHSCVSTLDFEYGPGGKPYLSNNTGINFNLSYSQNIAMVAVSMHRELGIDIQAIAQVAEPESVARLVFSPAEISYLLSLNVHERQMAFCQIWVHKEAYIKTLGTGFSRPTHTFSVCPAPGNIDALYHDESNPLAITEWRLIEIKAPTGYCAALAAAGRNWNYIEIESGIKLLNEF